MKRTRPSTIVSIAVVALVAGFAFDAVLASHQRPTAIPPLALGLVLFAIAAIVLSLAVPVYRVAHGRTHEPIDAYYATRVVLMAKACSIAGVLFGGVFGGLIAYMASRGVGVPVTSLVPTLVGTIGGAVLLAAGLVAEYMCTVPPSDDDRRNGDTQRI
ncbi:DUF3180 domain-containing protein [Frondihabitans cladoniiphilus]|uniref:DUF3180 domain-containing protein n=1 Tax=Frondihabitans cladoniiphilus TaxID=715785 RepID=A0ABP8VY24_9MICO